MITHINLDGITLEVEFDYEQPTYVYFGDLEALSEPKARATSVLWQGIDVLPLIKAFDLSEALNLIVVNNMEGLDE